MTRTPDAPDQEATDTTGKRRSRWPGWSKKAAAVVLLCTAALRVFVVEPVRVPSASMAPTLSQGDHLVSTTLGVEGNANDRGALITLRRPGSGILTLKRIAAVGGDLVEIRDGVLYVNGGRHTEPYVDARSVDSVYFGPVRVPKGTVFVLGGLELVK